MDYIPGGNLRSAYIDRDDPGVILRILREVAETVRHAHSRGVRHRDIKPENIIVAFDDEGGLIPYLTDFDLAYHETNRTMTGFGGVGGVLNYAAPEQMFEPNTDQARAPTVDIFSLAHLMFFVIVGRDPLPEARNSNLDALRKTLNRWVDGTVASPILELFSGCTERDPSDRPQDVVEFLSYLGRADAIWQGSIGQDDVSQEVFCQRLGHLYAGIGNYHLSGADEVRMASLSGQVAIVVRLRDVGRHKGEIVGQFEVEMSVAGNLSIPSMSTGKDARNSLNARLDKILSRFPHASRRAGSTGAFQTYIMLRNLPLNLKGLTIASDVLEAGVAGIEAW